MRTAPLESGSIRSSVWGRGATLRCVPTPTEGNVMRFSMLILTVILAGAALPAQAQAVIDVEGQQAPVPQVQDQGQAAPQAPLQTHESPQPPSSSRYSFNRVDDGFLRLDNASGEVAYCSARPVGWACEAVAIDRSVLETETTSDQKQVALLTKLDFGNRSAARRGCIAEEGNCGPEGAATAAAASGPVGASRERQRFISQFADPAGHSACARVPRRNLATLGRDDRHHSERHHA